MLFSLPLHSGTSISFLWLSYFFQQKYKAPLFEKQDRIDVSLPLPNTWYLSSPTQFVDYFQYWPIRGCYQGLYHYWYYYSNTRLQNIICMAMLLQPHLYSFIFTTWKGQQKKKKDSEVSLMGLNLLAGSLLMCSSQTVLLQPSTTVKLKEY